jgi:hypothetical protein
MTEPVSNPGASGTPNGKAADPLYQTLEWVLRSLEDPVLAAADWVAQEVDASRPSAVALLTDPAAPLSRVERARTFYMALRADGETAAERTMGGRMALAAAASALVHHGERLTPHDDAALAAAFRAAEQDTAVPLPLRVLLRRAIAVLPA